jgi:spectinomycin phosphotransferase
MTNSSREKCIIDGLNKHYGLNVTSLTFLPLGADLNSSVYKAETQEGLSYFVKVKSDFNPHSLAIIKLLDQVGIDLITPPVKTLDRQFYLHLQDVTLIVYPFIDGQDGFSRSLSDEQWVLLGRTLRQIHEINLPPLIQSLIRVETYSPKWRQIVQSMISYVQAEPTGCEIALKLRTFMQENLEAINRLTQRAEELAAYLQETPLNFVLCHADLHGGNIVIDQKNKAYIVDWDDPIMAPKERDLMFIGGGVGNVWNKPHEEDRFYEGYGRVEVNKTALAYYRYERIVEDIAEYCQEIFFTTAKSADKEQMYEHFIEMFEPRGVVEIAFETD